MSYINAEKALPGWLVETLRSYVGDGLIYIPPVDSSRRTWGSKSGARQMFDTRNKEIRMKKDAGVTVSQLADEYHLSEDMIRRIIHR